MALTLRWKPLMIVLLIGVIVFGGYFYWEEQIKIVPEELLARTMRELSQLETYRYRIDLQLLTEGYERYISAVEGVRAGADDFHLKGVIEGTEVEAYHIAGTTYLQTGGGEKWMTIPGNEVFTRDLFMVEIDPLASFKFAAVENLLYRGKINLDGHKLHVLNFSPQLEHPFMVKHWEDFVYTLMVKKNGELVRAEITAKLQAKPGDTMTMAVEIWDYHGKVTLTPPVQ